MNRNRDIPAIPLITGNNYTCHRLKGDRMNFQNILIPTDGSDNTKAAIAKGIELAKLSNGKITALYVRDKSATEETAKAAVGYVTEAGKAAGIPVTEEVHSGIPANIIARESARFDVVVMGTLGRTGVTKILVGSVAESVVKKSSCPVIVVKAAEVDKK
jgi:nucleotide-binding universal stress UspA family protein